MFSRLPEELNEHIISYFDPALDRKTLGALCRTNRLAYRLATPLFYQVVGVRGPESSDDSKYWQPLQLLCRTLVYNPTLISHVQKIDQYVGHGPAAIQSNFDIEHCRGTLALSGLEYKSYGPVVEAIASNSPPVFTDWVALLLLLCRNAITLDLGINWRWSEIDLLKRTLYELGASPDLCAVQYLLLDNLCGVDVNGGISLADIMPLLRIPSLRHLLVNGFEGTTESFTLNPHKSLQSNLEHLQIEACLTGTDELAPLLAFCPKIRSLTITWPFREENFWRDDWRVLGDALRKLSDLEALRIIHTKDLLLTVDRREAQGLAPPETMAQHVAPLGSLQSISNLKTLTVSDMALFGNAGFHPGDSGGSQQQVLATLLPESLQELTVLYHDIYLAGFIRLLPRDAMISRLKKFTLYNCQQDRWVGKDGMEYFKPVFGPARPPASDIDQQATDLVTRLSAMPVRMQIDTINEMQNHADQELPFAEAIHVNEMLEQVRRSMGIDST